MIEFEIVLKVTKWHLREPGAVEPIMEFDSRREVELFFKAYRAEDEQPVKVAFHSPGGQVERRIFKGRRVTL